VAGFQVAGGALLFFLSIIILFRGGWSEENLDSSSRGVFPIAFPLLAGPGAITTTILVLQRYGFMTSVLSVLIVSVLNFVILEFSDLFFRFLGKIGSAVVSRIMAVFISAIAVEYIITGIKTLLSASG
jgi:multiple antibiotic resistance protein